MTLYDEETLALYLERGVYGFLMTPVRGEVSTRSRHYHALADYACIRSGTHVFFFLKRRIVYGGQVLGSPVLGSFCLNGRMSPMGRLAEAPLVWDESARASYAATGEAGVFVVPAAGVERCQPYIIRFEDKLGLAGLAIASDQLYWELGKYPYPLPSNTIYAMSFCTLTPGEVRIALDLLTRASRRASLPAVPDDVRLSHEPLPFTSELVVPSLAEGFCKSLFVNEAHLEASVLASPMLLPAEMRPSDGAVVCRQVPLSPFKPGEWDRADVCYYFEPELQAGTLPNVVIELKLRDAGQREVEQVERYLDWLYMVLPSSEAARVRAYLFAPRFKKNAAPRKYAEQMSLVTPL